MNSAFGIDHGFISKGRVKNIAGLGALGAASGGTLAAGAGYLNGRVGRSNVSQTKKMGKAGGAVAGAGTGLVTAGPIGAVGGGIAGGVLGSKAAGAGAMRRIENNRLKREKK